MKDQPVINNATIAAIALVLAPIAARFGVDSDGVKTVLGLLVSAASAVVAVWRIWVARSKVTPLTKPRSASGHRLVVKHD